MHAKESFADVLAGLALFILERATDWWRGAFYVLMMRPLEDPSRKFTEQESLAMIGHLYRSEAHVARAIYRTALRMCGQPRRTLALKAFCLPPLKTPRHFGRRYARHWHVLAYTRRYAIRLAQRWKREAKDRARDPLGPLRTSRRRRFGVNGNSSSSSIAAAAATIFARARDPPTPGMNSAEFSFPTSRPAPA